MRNNIKPAGFILATAFIGSFVAVCDFLLIKILNEYPPIIGVRESMRVFSAGALVDIVFTFTVALALLGIYFLITAIRRKRPFSKEYEKARLLGLVFVSVIVFLSGVQINHIVVKNVLTFDGIIINSGILLVWMALGIAVWGFARIFANLSKIKWVKVSAYSFIIAVVVIIPFALVMPTPSEMVPKSRPIDGPNVLIITIDALRQDHVSAYGAGIVETPNIDRFAARGVLYKNAYTNAPWTAPSMFTMLSSKYPSEHKTTFAYSASSDIVVLTDILKSHRYETEAFIANTVMNTGNKFNRGFDRFENVGRCPFGFEPKITLYKFGSLVDKKIDYYFSEATVSDSTMELTDKLEKSLSRKRDKPFFIWAHYMDPHWPLTPPEKYMKGDTDFIARAYNERKNWVNHKEIQPVNREYIAVLYAGEVRYVDDMLGRVFDCIEANALYDNTIIILTADHGEEIFEHGRYGHAVTHYNEAMSIPFIIYYPGIEPGTEERPITLIDVAPTVIELVGADSLRNISGETLILGDDRPNDEGSLPFFDEIYLDPTYKSVRRGPYTLTRHGEGGDLEYFLIDNRVPEGPDDMLDPRGPLFDELKAVLDAWAGKIEYETAELGPGKEIKLGAEKEEVLKSLGYM